MGGCHFDQWLQTAIPTPAAHLGPGQDDHDSRPGKSTSAGPGVICPPGQGRHRGSRSSAATQRLLFDVLPRTQEDRWISSHSRSSGTQSLHESFAIPHADHSRSSSVSGRGRMVHFNRLEGRLLSCAHCRRTSALPQICLQRSSLAIQGTPFRSFPFTEGVYSGCQGGPRSFAGQRNENLTVPGRLANLCSVQSHRSPRHRTSACPCGQLGSSGKSREEQPISIPGYSIPGAILGHSGYGSSSVTSQGGRYSPYSLPFQAGESPSFCRLPSTDGEADLCNARRASRLAIAAPLPELAEQFPPKSRATQDSKVEGYVAVPPCTGPMEGQVLPVQGGSHGVGGVSEGSCYHRRLPFRMGCRVAAQGSSGELVSEGSLQAHKCVRAACSLFGSQAFFTSFARQTCSHSVRQHLDRLPCQSSGGHQVGTASASVPTSINLGCTSSVYTTGGVPSRRGQSGRRLPVSPEASSRRVVPPPRGGVSDLEPFRAGRGGFICLRGVDEVSSVVLSQGCTGSPGSRCAGTSVASVPVVRFSAPSSDLADSAESPQRGSPVVVGGPVLAGATVVPAVAQTMSRHSLEAPGQERPSVSIEGSDMASRPPPTSTVALALGGPMPQLTDSVRLTILNAKAVSTRQQYSNRWKLFSQWCSARREDPVSCSIPIILEFLQALLDDGRSPSTLKVYVAAISCYHSRVENCSVGSHSLVSLFLRGARRLHPRVAPRAPVWDLSLVLEALCNPPFEPLAQAELKWLSFKTAFLLAIVSAKRVSELHALSVSPSCLRWCPDDSGVTLWPNMAFLPKVVSRSHCNQPLRLARFNPSERDGGDRPELCPVRALRAYVAATTGIRRSDQLFLCYGGFKMGYPLSKQRLSHWIVEVIRHAYRSDSRSPPSGVRAHSTRSVSTSWAAMRGVSLETICAAASWASPSTFTRFYNVNVATPHPLGHVLFQRSSESSQ